MINNPFATLIIAIILSLLIASCATYEKSSCNTLLRTMNDLYCEDNVLQGFTAAYLGKEKWAEIVDAYIAAKSKTKYGSGCGNFYGHWVGRKMYQEDKQ